MKNTPDDKFPNDRLKEIAFGLRELLKRCRPDMHSPSQQTITAEVVGTVFDNAGTPNEMIVVLTDTVTKRQERINLCNLIALARLA